MSMQVVKQSLAVHPMKNFIETSQEKRNQPFKVEDLG